MIWLAVALIAVVYIAFVVISNKIVKLKNKMENSWANIETQLQRRFDLVPNLVETVKGFAAHNAMIVQKVNETINAFLTAQSIEDKIKTNDALTGCLNALYKVSENCAELRTDKNFLELQKALAEIEEDIAYARQFYNDSVTIYNNAIMTFPNSLVASKLGFTKATPFQATREAIKAPVIDLQPKKESKYSQCPNCGAAVGDGITTCQFCGRSLV